MHRNIGGTDVEPSVRKELNLRENLQAGLEDCPVVVPRMPFERLQRWIYDEQRLQVGSVFYAWQLTASHNLLVASTSANSCILERQRWKLVLHSIQHQVKRLSRVLLETNPVVRGEVGHCMGVVDKAE